MCPTGGSHRGPDEGVWREALGNQIVGSECWATEGGKSRKEERRFVNVPSSGSTLLHPLPPSLPPSLPTHSLASVHLPRIGHSTPNFNWYGTERLIRKYLVSQGISTYMYPPVDSKKHSNLSRQINLLLLLELDYVLLPYSAHMSPESTHKLVGLHGAFNTRCYTLVHNFCSFKLFPIGLTVYCL